jgi:hypothetical protein
MKEWSPLQEQKLREAVRTTASANQQRPATNWGGQCKSSRQQVDCRRAHPVYLADQACSAYGWKNSVSISRVLMAVGFGAWICVYLGVVVSKRG